MRTFVSALLRQVSSMGEVETATAMSISIWKESRERESELVTKSLKLLATGHFKKAHGMIARTFALAEAIARGDVEAMNKKYKGFPVLEHEIGTLLKKTWFVYIASVNGKSESNSKTCLLLLVEGKLREEARRRASIWIEKCPDREAQGDPVFVNLLGRVLESADHPAAGGDNPPNGAAPDAR